LVPQFHTVLPVMLLCTWAEDYIYYADADN